MTLILNSSNLTSINPVNVNGGINIDILSNGFFFISNLFGKIGTGEFFTGQIEELGDTIGTSLVLLNDFKIGGENLDSVLFEIRISELLVVGTLPLSPKLIDGFVLNLRVLMGVLDCE